MIRYRSTRGSSDVKTAAQAVIQGIAEDKGLYVPDEVPALPLDVEKLAGNRSSLLFIQCPCGHRLVSKAREI